MSRIQKHTIQWFKKMVGKELVVRSLERKNKLMVSDEDHAYALYSFQNELGYRYYEVKKIVA